MPQFRLTTAHHDGTNYLEAGTIVGDNTPYPWRDPLDPSKMAPPSLGMVGVDEESQAIIDKHYNENVRRDPMLPESGKEGDEAAATADMTMNKPNPNLQPGPADPSRGGPQLTQPPRAAGEPLGLLAGGPGPVKPSGPARSPADGPEGKAEI